MHFTCFLDLLITFDQAGLSSTRCTIDHKKEKPVVRLQTSIQYKGMVKIRAGGGGGEGWCIFILAYQFWGDPPHSRCRKMLTPQNSLHNLS